MVTKQLQLLDNGYIIACLLKKSIEISGFLKSLENFVTSYKFIVRGNGQVRK